MFVKYIFYLFTINSIFLIVGYSPLGKYSVAYGMVPFIKNYVSGNTFCAQKSSGYNIWGQNVAKRNVVVNNDMCMSNLTVKKNR